MKEDLIRFISKYQVFIFPVLAAALSLVVLLLVIVPQIIAFFHTSGQISDLKRRTTLLDQKTQQLKQIDKHTYQSNLQVALISLPQEKDLPTTIGQIQTLLANNQLQLVGMSFLTSSDVVQGQQTYSVKIDVSGTQVNLQKFLTDLKNAPQIMQLNSLEETISRNGVSQFEVTVQTFYSPLPNSIGSIEQPLDNLSKQDTELLTKLQQRTQTLPVISSSNLNIPRGKSNPFQ